MLLAGNTIIVPRAQYYFFPRQLQREATWLLSAHLRSPATDFVCVLFGVGQVVYSVKHFFLSWISCLLHLKTILCNGFSIRANQSSKFRSTKPNKWSERSQSFSITMRCQTIIKPCVWGPEYRFILLVFLSFNLSFFPFLRKLKHNRFRITLLLTILGYSGWELHFNEADGNWHYTVCSYWFVSQIFKWIT